MYHRRRHRRRRLAYGAAGIGLIIIGSMAPSRGSNNK